MSISHRFSLKTEYRIRQLIRRLIEKLQLTQAECKFLTKMHMNNYEEYIKLVESEYAKKGLENPFAHCRFVGEQIKNTEYQDQYR